MTRPRAAWYRALFCLLLAGVLLSLSQAQAGGEGKGFKVGLTAVFLDNQTSFIRQWEKYLARRLGEPFEFVQRQSYREITQMLAKGQLDAAWICGFPYVRYRPRIRLLAVPLYHGEPLYQSYLIVPASDHVTRGIEDLRGRVFAYSDPDSNSGFLVPQVELLRRGIDPARFFGKTFFTWSHRDVVVAVADGVAQGGAVDGYVWDTLSQTHPQLTNRTRVVARSRRYGFPPFAASATLDQRRFERLQQVLLGMPDDAEGQRLLQKLNLDGFTSGDDSLFDGIREEVVLFEEGKR